MLWRVIGLLAIVALPISFSLIKRSAAGREPIQDEPSLRFDVAPGMSFLIGAVEIALAAFSLLVFIFGLVRDEGWYAAFVPFAVLVAIVIATPKTIVLDHNGIRQRHFLIGERSIAWNDIAWIRRGWRTGTIYVKSKNGGLPVRFSTMHVGKSRFEQEVRKHASQDAELG